MIVYIVSEATPAEALRAHGLEDLIEMAARAARDRHARMRLLFMHMLL